MGGQDDEGCGQIRHVAKAHRMTSPMASHKTSRGRSPTADGLEKENT